MKILEKTDTSSKHAPISTEANICTFLNDFGFMSSSTTARKVLKLFKERIYLCSFDLTNPMYLDIAKQKTQLDDEQLYIYELMYKYFCNDQFNCFSFSKHFPDIGYLCSPRYKVPDFTWHVPFMSMPFLALCISITNSKPVSIDKFYNKMDNAFQLLQEGRNCSFSSSWNYSEADFNLILNAYHSWSNIFLGRTYFSTLENIYKLYAKNEDQKNRIRNSLYSITQIMVEGVSYSCRISEYMTLLLIDFENHLAEYEQTDLYPHEKSIPFQLDESFYEKLKADIQEPIIDLLKFIKTNQMNHSIPGMYNISINNCDMFNDTCLKQLDYIQIQLDTANATIIQYLNSYKMDSSIMNDIQNHRISLEKELLDLHIKNITNIFSKQYTEIERHFKHFIKAVKRASDPQNFNKHHIAPDILVTLENDIVDDLASLYSKLTK